MRTFPRLSRYTAFLLLIASTAMTTAVWHVGEDDTACVQVLEIRGEVAPPTVAAARSTAAPQHCLLCHWTRWVRPLTSTRSYLVAPLQDATRFVDAIPLGERQHTRGLAPGRAPPGSPALQISFI
jgi:hypothetical protein